MNVVNKQLFFLLSFSYSELLEIAVHYSLNLRIFRNSFFDVVGVFRVLVTKMNFWSF